MIIPLIFVLRRSLQENRSVLQRSIAPTPWEILQLSPKTGALLQLNAAGGDDHHNVFYFITVIYADLWQNRA